MEKEYNEDSINFLGDFAKEFFESNKETDFSKNYFQNPNGFYSEIKLETVNQRNALDNYIIKNYNTIKDKNKLNTYLKNFYIEFLNNPTELLSSPFLKHSTMVDRFCPDINIKINEKIYRLRDYVKITYKNNTIHSVEEIKNMDFNNLSKEQKNKLMHSFIKNIDTKNEELRKLQEQYIKKLIDENTEVKNLEAREVEFISKYTNKQMLKNLHYDDKIKNDIFIMHDKENKGGFQYSSLIYINKDSILNQSILDLMQTVCHETEHSIQDYRAQNDLKYTNGLEYAIDIITRDYYRKRYNYDVYNGENLENYRTSEIEKDAEQEGHLWAGRILRNLGYKEERNKMYELGKNKEKQRYYEYNFVTVPTENGKIQKMTRENFVFSSMKKIMEEHPEYINKYPVLANLFEKDGSLKKFEELIKSKYSIYTNDMQKAFLIQYIRQGKLNDLNLKDFNEEEQFTIASRLINIIENQQEFFIKSSKNEIISEKIKRSYDENHLKETLMIAEFMNNNYEQFYKLQNLENGEKFSHILPASNIEGYYKPIITSMAQDNFWKNINSDQKGQMKLLAKKTLEKMEQEYQKRKIEKLKNNALLNSAISATKDSTKTSDINRQLENIKYIINERNEKTNEMEK